MVSLPNDDNSNADDEARRSTTEDIKEMEELLPSILRAHGVVEAKDGDSIDTLDGVHFKGLVCYLFSVAVAVLVVLYILRVFGMHSLLCPMYGNIYIYIIYMVYRKASAVQKSVYRDYVRELKRRHDAFYYLPDENFGCTLPLHLMIWEVIKGGSWSDVELLLSKIPCEMAKQALMYKDEVHQCTPLFLAAGDAPRSIIQRMLELAPESKCLKDKKGRLALHKAANSNNAAAAEILVSIYPRGMLVKGGSFLRHIVYKTPLDIAFDGLAYEVIKSMIRGLVNGLCGNKCDCTKLGSYEKIISVLSRIKIEEDVLWQYIGLYECKKSFNIAEMLLRYHIMAIQKEAWSDLVYTRACLVNTFGFGLGTRAFTYLVDYKLCLIGEERDRKRKAEHVL